MIYFLLLFLITSCLPSCPQRTERYQEAIRVRGKYAEFAIQEGLKPFGFGEGVSGDIENLNLSFIHIANYSIEEARIHMVYHAEKFLSIINEDRRIRPHLHEFPATNKLIKLCFIFRNTDKSEVFPPFMSSVKLISGKIYYCIEAQDFFDRLIHQETYEEALEWVKENATEVLLPCEIPIEI